MVFVSFDHGSYAQIKRCSTTEAEKVRSEKYEFLPTEGEFEDWMAAKLKERRNKLVPFRTSGVGDPDLIAVVVHVVHNGERYGKDVNITDEQIFSQIEVLNEDYQRKNADTINTQTEFLNVASKLNIEFVLARQDESGNPTSGIVRVEGELPSYDPLGIADRELLSSYSHWDPNRYLNIWVTNLRSPYIGLAQFPDHNLPGLAEEENKDNIATDGLVIDYQAFGSEEKVPGLKLLPDYNLGRTTTHEIGHFFGLKHVWGDGGCSADDYVSDTPFSENDYSGICTPADAVSCSSNDMFENFLYYTNDQCMNIFTVGQISRMEIILDEAPRRNTLLNSSGTNYPDDKYVDMAVKSIKYPGKVLCEEILTPVVEILNNGTVPVASFGIEYSVDGITQTYIYAGDSIYTAEAIEIELAASSLTPGTYELSIELTNVTGDANGANDRMNLVFAVDTQTDFIPLREQFDVLELPSTNWVNINEDNDLGWELTNAPNITDQNTAAYMNFYNYENRQEMDWLISPALDFSGAVEASVTFKTSYARNDGFLDQLSILMSTNCGYSFDDLLLVLNSDDLSISESTDFWKPTGLNDWIDHTIDLGDYAGMSDVRLAFLARNDFGNNLYLDDIEFFTTAREDIVRIAEGTLRLYPNPSQDGQIWVTFNTSRRQNIEVMIYDGMGKMMVQDNYPNTLNQTYSYDLTGYRSGVYILHAIGEDFVRTERMIINR